MTDGMTAGDRVVIRCARSDDGPRLVELLVGGTLSHDEDAADPQPYQAALDDIIADPGADILVAEATGEVVGFCQLITFRHLQERGGRCAEIESVHVDRQWRSRGIGARLLAEAVARARTAGCYRVQLTTNCQRVDAQRFYVREGFQPTHVGFKLPLGHPS